MCCFESVVFILPDLIEEVHGIKSYLHVVINLLLEPHLLEKNEIVTQGFFSE
jgi:hypothetical protein